MWLWRSQVCEEKGEQPPMQREQAVQAPHGRDVRRSPWLRVGRGRPRLVPMQGHAW